MYGTWSLSLDIHAVEVKFSYYGNNYMIVKFLSTLSLLTYLVLGIFIWKPHYDNFIPHFHHYVT